MSFEFDGPAYGRAAKHDFFGEHRNGLEQPKWATDSAGWYWTSGSSMDLNTLADQNDLLAITTHINGAFNGFEDRRKLLVAAFIHLKACLERSESRQEGSEPSVG